MGLSDKRVGAVVAVSDMGKAKKFYEGKLGLSGGEDRDDGGTTYSCAGETTIHVYPSPDNAGKSAGTLAAFDVEDCEGTVDELAGNGVEFEQYGDPINTNQKGIAELGGIKVAWFKDPDGNTIGIAEE